MFLIKIKKLPEKQGVGSSILPLATNETVVFLRRIRTFINTLIKTLAVSLKNPINIG